MVPVRSRDTILPNLARLKKFLRIKISTPYFVPGSPTLWWSVQIRRMIAVTCLIQRSLRRWSTAAGSSIIPWQASILKGGPMPPLTLPWIAFLADKPARSSTRLCGGASGATAIMRAHVGRLLWMSEYFPALFCLISSCSICFCTDWNVPTILTKFQSCMIAQDASPQREKEDNCGGRCEASKESWLCAARSTGEPYWYWSHQRRSAGSLFSPSCGTVLQICMSKWTYVSVM